MTERAELERIILAAYAARKVGDLDAMGRIFADNALFRMSGSLTASPVAVQALGAKSFRSVLKEMITVFEWLDQEIISIVIDGPRAAVRWRGKIRSTATGETVDTELADFFEFEDGRISSLVEFCDTALAARLMGAAR